MTSTTEHLKNIFAFHQITEEMLDSPKTLKELPGIDQLIIDILVTAMECSEEKLTPFILKSYKEIIEFIPELEKRFPGIENAIDDQIKLDFRNKKI